VSGRRTQVSGRRARSPERGPRAPSPELRFQPAWRKRPTVKPARLGGSARSTRSRREPYCAFCELKTGRLARGAGRPGDGVGLPARDRIGWARGSGCRRRIGSSAEGVGLRDRLGESDQVARGAPLAGGLPPSPAPGCALYKARNRRQPPLLGDISTHQLYFSPQLAGHTPVSGVLQVKGGIRGDAKRATARCHRSNECT
jgi:hypothetical protein